MSLPAPSTPLLPDFAQKIAHRYDLKRRMRRVRRMIEDKPTRKLLRSHLDRTIEWEEIKERDNLDELLACLSVLHISGFDTRESLEGLGVAVDDLLDLLEHPDVARYFEAYYPFAPPVLLRASYVDRDTLDYVERLAHERQKAGWVASFQQFLALDAVFNAPGPLKDFLGVLDDYTIDDFDLADIRKALRSRQQMRRFLGHRMGRRLVEGLQDFYDFSEDLDAFLASCTDYPLFRGLVWLNYGYWYGAGGDQMSEVVRWIFDALVKLPDPDADPGRIEHFRSIIERLTDLRAYPNEVLTLCAPQLERWIHHVRLPRDVEYQPKRARPRKRRRQSAPEGLRQPVYLLQMAIEPKTAEDFERLEVALASLAGEGAPFSYLISDNDETRQVVVNAESETDLEILVDRITREFKVDAYVGAPQVAYREYLAKPVELTYAHKKHMGGLGQFGEVKVKLTPGELGSGVIFRNEVEGGNIPAEFIPSIEKGMRETAETGALIGFPIVDFEIRLLGGKYHDVDSSALAFEITGRGAMREAAQKAGIHLLEPVMWVEVVTPEEYLGEVIGDFTSRRAQLQGTASRGARVVVEGLVPLANMFGYANELRNFTRGRARYAMRFAHYQLPPPSVAEDMKAKLA